MGEVASHYAIIGMAYVVADYPLYYDAINEKGLGMAGLNFVGNAVYQQVEEGRENVAQFELFHGSSHSVRVWRRQKNVLRE